MLPDANAELIKLNEIASKLKVEFPYTIGCKIDELNRTAVVDRMELYLDGDHSIPAGWRGKICMFSGIDRRVALYDGIVLPAIVPGGKTPIGPYLVEDISNDFLGSKDDWKLEFSIVDAYGNEECILLAPVTRRKPNDAQRQFAEMKESELKLIEQDKAHQEQQEELNQTVRALSRQKAENRTLQVAMEAVEEELKQKEIGFKEELEGKDRELKQLSVQVLNSIHDINELQARRDEIRNERDELKTEQERILKLVAELKDGVNSLDNELTTKIGQLTNQQEYIERLESERDRAVLQAEDHKTKIEGLRAELEAKQDIFSQRTADLEAKTSQARGLETELQKVRESLAEREKIAQELAEKLLTNEAENIEIQTKLNELREELTHGIVKRDQDERESKTKIEAYANQVETLRKELETKKNELVEREDRLASRNVKLNEMTDQLEKLQEDIRRLEDERNQAIRLTEELNSRVQGIQTEFEGNRELYAQRSQQLELETTRSRMSERELERIKGIQARHEKVIEQQVATINRLSDERDQAEMKASQLRARSNSLESTLGTQKANAVRLEEKLTTAQEQAEALKIEYAQVKEDLTKLELKFEKRIGGQLMYERYELIRQISQSDTGEAYKVYDKELGRAVMLKILPPAMTSDRRALRQLTTEAQLLARLNHRNTVCLYDFVQADEPYILMEYVEGRTLRQLINTKTPLPLDQVLDIVQQVCRGLSFAHGQGIYHRSLSPEYLMIGDNGFIKIMDFGLAETIRTTMIRLTGSISPAMLSYLSPEQILGKSKFDGRSDIYSLGIVFYEILSGQLPFTGKDVNSQYTTARPQPIDHVSPEINSILQKCLEKKIEDRYADADELRKAVLEVKRAIN